MTESSQQLESRIVDLESKVAFQDYTIEELNRVLTDQQQQISELTQLVTQVREWVVNLQQPNIATPDQETPPPHY